MSLGPLYVLFGEVSVQVLCPFFSWVVCLPIGEMCVFFIYFGDQTKISLANVFFHTVSSLSILLMFYLAVQKLFILMKSYLFILSFMSFALGDIPVKIFVSRISEISLPMFSSRTDFLFHNLYLNLIHLEFIFCA